MDFSDLDDEIIKEKLSNFHDGVDKIDKILQEALSEKMCEIYQNATTKEKVDFDLFLTYTLNTLYWLHLRAKGEDPNENEVKGQLTRVKEYMIKAKQAHERFTIRPTVDVPAAKRFIKHGLQIYTNDSEERPNKKIKFDESM